MTEEKYLPKRVVYVVSKKKDSIYVNFSVSQTPKSIYKERR